MARGLSKIPSPVWLAIAGIGFLMCLFSLVSHYSFTDLQKHGQEAQAVVLEDRTQEFSRRRGSNRLIHRAAVGYVVNDQKYTGTIASDGLTKVGDLVDVVYDPNNPEEVSLKRVVAGEDWGSFMDRSFPGFFLIILGLAGYWTTRKD